MPTKKRRVGFIPRSDVLALINKLSNDSNLSYSKIINILVEEALYKRGLFNKVSEDILVQNSNIENNFKHPLKIESVNKEFKYNFKNKLLSKENQIFKEVKEEPFDDEIYSKFLIFLQFQERMKKKL